MNRGTNRSASRRARLTTRGLIWRSRPTSCQAWLRVSNIFGGVLGIVISLSMMVAGHGDAPAGAGTPEPRRRRRDRRSASLRLGVDEHRQAEQQAIDGEGNQRFGLEPAHQEAYGEE